MHKKDFLLHLIGEMSHFFLDTNPSKMVISLHQEKDGIHFAIFDDHVRSDEELTSIREALNSSRRPELAGYYGNMSGFDFVGDPRLDLVGWQIKYADVGRIDKGTRIDLWLGGDEFDPNNFTIPDK